MKNVWFSAYSKISYTGKIKGEITTACSSWPSSRITHNLRETESRATMVPPLALLGKGLSSTAAGTTTQSVTPHQVSIIHLLLDFRFTYLKGFKRIQF